MKPAKSIRPSDGESIDATAAAWLAQRDEAMTADDEVAFAAWRAADPRHEAAVLRLQASWANLQQLRDFRPAALRHPDPDLLAPVASKRPIPFPVRALEIGLAAAAVLMMAAIVTVFLPGRTSALVAYSTTVGGYQRVMLADGSVLELNGDTEATVRFSPSERRVQLARGEAHFTVAKNKARPFWVEASGISVRAVGTAFNVRLGSGEVEVLVTEGKVELAPTPASALPGNPALSLPRVNPVSLIANERARIGTELAAQPASAPLTPMVERVDAEAMREALAWQGPRLVFVDTPLSEAVEKFNHRNAIQLVLADPEVAKIPVGGNFRAENVEAFVRLLESGGDVVVEQRDTTHVVLHRAK